MGVTEQDFMKVRTKAELRTLFEKIGYVYKVGKFNAIFNRSRVLSAHQLGKELPQDYSTARGMMNAIQEMHNLE